MNFLEKGLVNEAYEATRRSLPDARIFVQPQITWNTIHSTPNATANSTLRFLTRLLHAEDQRPLHAQVLLSGDFWGIHGVCGVPVTINSDGWRVREIESLAGEERLRILDATASIERYITEVRSAALDTVVFQAASAISMASSSIVLSEDIFENSASLCTT
jgi:malate dehydrogenase